MKDYNGNPLAIGDAIKSIESGWRGVIQVVEEQGGDTMLGCYGIDWWTGEADLDDIQYFDPRDVVKSSRVSPDGAPVNPLNFQ